MKTELLSKGTSSAAVSQLREWSNHGDPLHCQWKTIVKVNNPDVLNAGFTVNKLVRQYNGKPFLSNMTHDMTREGGKIVLNFDVHIFSFIARKIYFEQVEMFPQLVLDVGFVVEGREDRFLPEQTLGCMRLFNINPGKPLAGISDCF